MSTFEITKSYRVPGLYEANGGTTWYPPGSNSSDTPPAMIWCDEGDFDHPSALISVDVKNNKSEPIVTSFMGKNFSSVNDVRQHPVTGDIWCKQLLRQPSITGNSLTCISVQSRMPITAGFRLVST